MAEGDERLGLALRESANNSTELVTNARARLLCFFCRSPPSGNHETRSKAPAAFVVHLRRQASRIELTVTAYLTVVLALRLRFPGSDQIRAPGLNQRGVCSCRLVQSHGTRYLDHSISAYRSPAKYVVLLDCIRSACRRRPGLRRTPIRSSEDSMLILANGRVTAPPQSQFAVLSRVLARHLTPTANVRHA